MGVRTTGTDPAVVLYDSVTGMPLPTEVFTSDEEAEAFLAFIAEYDSGYADPRELSAIELADRRRRFMAAR